MTQTVTVPGVGDLEFPDGMSQEEMAAAIQKNFPQIHSQPQQENTWGNALRNVADVGLKKVGDIGGGMLGDIAGLGALTYDSGMNSALSLIGKNRGPSQYADPTKVRDAVANYFAYHNVANPDSATMKVADFPGKVLSGAGNALASNFDNPYVQDVARAAPAAAAQLIGMKAAAPAGLARTAESGFGLAAKETPVATQIAKPPVPTTAELKDAANTVYANAKKSGVIIDAKDYGSALDNIQKMAADEGINPTLHPKSTAVLKAFDEAGGKSLTLPQVETLRKIALDAEDDLNPVTRQPTPDARLAGKIVDSLDNSVEALTAYTPARALWSRMRRSQLIDNAIERAQIKAGANYTQAGMETALRQEFRQLALNPRRMRGLTPLQQDAIKKVAQGGKVENTLRTLGKFDPTSGVVSALGSLGSAQLLSHLTPAGLALPVVGFAAKRAATKMTANNVAAAREALVGRGLPEMPQAKRGVFDSIGKSSEAESVATPRSSTQIKLELQRLQAQMMSVPSGADAVYVQGLKRRWDQLQGELKQQLSQEASGGANAQGPTK